MFYAIGAIFAEDDFNNSELFGIKLEGVKKNFGAGSSPAWATIHL